MRRYWILTSTSVLLLGNSIGTLAQRAAATQTQSAKTSYQLIDEALAAKRIDEETAHKYRVFAGFGDSRLPAPYRGANGAFELPPEIEEIESLLDTFSAQTKAEIAPFFMRPEEPGSWITLPTVGEQPTKPSGPPSYRGSNSVLRGKSHDSSPMQFARLVGPPGQRWDERSRLREESHTPSGWKTFSGANGKAKVWAQDRYPGDDVKAQALASELTRIIWDKLVNLMGPEPLSDGSHPRNGGDGALDFYLVHAPPAIDPETGKPTIDWVGTARTAPGFARCGASYILLDSNQPIGSPTSPGIVTTAAHELMHLIARAVRPRDNNGCGDRWIQEASATWAEEYVYPKANAEHIWPKEYFAHPRQSLDLSNRKHEYGAYLLPFFMQKAGGGEKFMPAIWEQMRTKTALRAIDDAMPGGFDKWWPKFLIANRNLEPVDQPNGYRGWDGVTPYAGGLRQEHDLAGTNVRTVDLPFDFNSKDGPPGLPYLTGAYFDLTFKPSIRSVVFENEVAYLAQSHKSVWGLQKIRGSWRDPEDWTNEVSKVWCRDEAKQDVEQLVIIFGNADWQTKKMVRPPTDPVVKAYPTGCAAWTSNTVVTTTMPIPDKASTITEVVRSNARFIVDTSFNVPGEPHRYWKVVSGRLSWEARVTGQCTGGKSGNRAVNIGGDGNPEAMLNIWDDGGKMVVQVPEGPWPGDIPTYTINCPNDPPVMMILYSGGTGLGISSNLPKENLDPGGKSFGGNYTVDMGGGVKRQYQYTFRVAP